MVVIIFLCARSWPDGGLEPPADGFPVAAVEGVHRREEIEMPSQMGLREAGIPDVQDELDHVTLALAAPPVEFFRERGGDKTQFILAEGMLDEPRPRHGQKLEPPDVVALAVMDNAEKFRERVAAHGDVEQEPRRLAQGGGGFGRRRFAS